MVAEIACPEPVEVDRATYLMFGNRTYDNVTYVCETDHRITGTSTNTTNATCGHDDNFQGIWLNVPTCEGMYLAGTGRILLSKYFIDIL